MKRGRDSESRKRDGKSNDGGKFRKGVKNETNKSREQCGDRYSKRAAKKGYMKSMREKVLNRQIGDGL